MHLVIVTPEYPPHAGGGILKFYRVLAPRYAAAGHRVTVLVANPFHDRVADYEHNGVVVRSVPRQTVRTCASRFPHLSAAPLLRQWLGAASAAAREAFDCSPDVIEATDFGVMFAPLLIREERPPVIVQMHGSLGQISIREPVLPRDELDLALARVVEASLLPVADEIQAYGRLNCEEWSRRLQADCAFIPPALDQSLSRVGHRASGAAGPALVVARVQPWKGPELLCEAVGRLGLSRDALSVEWVGRDTATAPGGGSLSAHLAARYPDVWGRSIHAVGPQAPDEVWAKQQAARFVIVPSAWDTFNLTVAEAMAAERVVVCSDGVGASFLIRDGANGFLFKAGDADSLAGVLRRVLDLSAAELGAIGEAAQSTVVRELDPDRIACERLGRMQALVSSTTRRIRPVSDWLAGFVDGSGDRRADSGFLHSVSIREITRHVVGRLHGRLLGRPPSANR